MTQLSQEYFDEKVDNFATKRDLKKLASKTDLTALMADMDDRFKVVNTKLDAMMKIVVTRDEVRSLVRQLKDKGTELDEQKIFIG